MDRDLATEYGGRSLPEGWVVWSEEDGLVVCYKPDVFNASDYPRPCLPLITVSQADVGTVGGREGWRVSFHLEADVQPRELEEVHVDYDEALDYVVEVARKFNRGDLDLRSFYAEGDAREDYLRRIERETGG